MIDYSDLTDKAMIDLRDFASSPAVRRAARVELQRRRDAAKQAKVAEWIESVRRARDGRMEGAINCLDLRHSGEAADG